MKIKRIIPLLIIVLLLVFGQGAYAANYSVYLGKCYTHYGMISYTPFNVDLLGINKTHGFTQRILGTISIDQDSNRGDIYLYYTVPNDGSTWEILGTAIIQEVNGTSSEGIITTSFTSYNVDQTQTTSGTFTGVSIGQAVTAANSANTAANNAKTSADTASARALNAYNSVYNANGNTIMAVRDASGTVLSEARQAKTNSQNAYNTAQAVNTKIDSLSTAVTNIQNNFGVDTSPPEVKITTVSGAMATSGNFIKAIIDASDNLSTTFSYCLDGIEYQPLPSDGVVDLPVYSSGTNLITVWVKDEAGNRGRVSIKIRKL